MSATIKAGIVVLVLALSPFAAMAQRNGDVRNGFDNQPTSGEVRSRERAAGVAPPPEQQRAQTGNVDAIYRQLMTKERQDGATNAPADPAAAGPAPNPR